MLDFFAKPPISPHLEMGAYEALWAEPGASAEEVAKRFRGAPGRLPSELVGRETAEMMADRVHAILKEAQIGRYGVRVHGDFDYPQRLRDASNPAELLYFQGIWNLIETPCIAVVGSRGASDDGRRRARKLVRALVRDGWTIVSGLARGIDTAAHTAALEAGGFTIGVLGTPISERYPRENAALQAQIAEEHLLISEFPVCWHANAHFWQRKRCFPQRNFTMSALTVGTVIVEANPKSGTLIQARAALEQRRRLFVLNSCFETNDRWPRDLEARGAIRVRTYDDIARSLGPARQQH